MNEIINYSQCNDCKARIQSEWINFHDCENEQKLKEIESKLQTALDDNLKLKIQNADLKKNIDLLRKEVNLSFQQMKSIVDGYHKKLEEKQIKESAEEKKESA